MSMLRQRLNADGGLSTPTFGRNNEYRLAPIDQVPMSLRGYASIDPRHRPAPLRGRGLVDEIGYEYPPGPPGHGCVSFTQPRGWARISDLRPEKFC